MSMLEYNPGDEYAYINYRMAREEYDSVVARNSEYIEQCPVTTNALLEAGEKLRDANENSSDRFVDSQEIIKARKDYKEALAAHKKAVKPFIDAELKEFAENVQNSRRAKAQAKNAKRGDFEARREELRQRSDYVAQKRREAQYNSLFGYYLKGTITLEDLCKRAGITLEEAEVLCEKYRTKQTEAKKARQIMKNKARRVAKRRVAKRLETIQLSALVELLGRVAGNYATLEANQRGVTLEAVCVTEQHYFTPSVRLDALLARLDGIDGAHEAERLKAERLEAERLEAERLEAERLKAERLEAERLEAERLKAERLEAKCLEAKRINRINSLRNEMDRLEAEAKRLEAERNNCIEALRTETDQLNAGRLKAENQST